MKSSRLLFVVVPLIPLLAMIGCTGDTGPAGPSGTESCSQCHNATNVITGKHDQWAQSLHATGTAYLRGTSADCAGCHSGHAAGVRMDAGLAPDQVTAGDVDPTPVDCRACHKIHTSYTSADWTVHTTAPVAFYAAPGVTYNGGLGNLCANCHQPRRIFPEAVNDSISGISSHWGPHHGPQSAMILGVAGAGVPDQANAHPHMNITDSCVHCHMGDDREHLFEPSVDRCTECHTDATNFDINNVQTDVTALSNQLGDLLVAAGLIDQNTPDGHPIVTKAQVDQAVALWNWLYVAHEDKSLGVHNGPYAKALLQEGINRLTP